MRTDGRTPRERPASPSSPSLAKRSPPVVPAYRLRGVQVRLANGRPRALHLPRRKDVLLKRSPLIVTASRAKSMIVSNSDPQRLILYLRIHWYLLCLLFLLRTQPRFSDRRGVWLPLPKSTGISINSIFGVCARVLSFPAKNRRSYTLFDFLLEA